MNELGINCPSVHIAGTNGKGSVSTKIAKALEYSGYRVGLFTSPHIQNFGERIQINGVQISDDDIERYLSPLLKKFPNRCFFDCTTFCAFQYFNEKNVDIAVVETGIGGLHDITNVLEPRLSVITTISFDHMDRLGSTLDEIAFQKAGIIKPNTPVVVGPKAYLTPVIKRAAALKSPLIKVPEKFEDFDAENQRIARAALELLTCFFCIPEAATEQGLLQKPPCRFERHGRFVLDVAHNVEGFEALLKAWDIHHPEKKFVAIMGFSLDKDIESCLNLMAQKAEHLFLVSAGSERAASLEQLKEILRRRKISHFTACETLEYATQQALAGDHDILICGSFYIMQQARQQVFRL